MISRYKLRDMIYLSIKIDNIHPKCVMTLTNNNVPQWEKKFGNHGDRLFVVNI